MKFGWIPDIPDHRDFRYAAKPKTLKEGLPESVDMRQFCPPVYDQGDLGSCTANAIGAMHQFISIKQGLSIFTPSRLFLYYRERELEGTIESDSGAMIRDGMKVLAADGICSEDLWPYDGREAQWNTKFRVRPTPECFVQAEKHQALQYDRVDQSLNMLKACLAEHNAFVFGFAVFPSIEVAGKTGVLPMPKQNERMQGGHAVMAVGYDDKQQRFLIRNSWGEKWGQDGYFWMPYAYLLDFNLSDDFWTLRLVET